MLISILACSLRNDRPTSLRMHRGLISHGRFNLTLSLKAIFVLYTRLGYTENSGAVHFPYVCALNVPCDVIFLSIHTLYLAQFM